jgi:hypothetical protein
LAGTHDHKSATGAIGIEFYSNVVGVRTPVDVIHVAEQDISVANVEVKYPEGGSSDDVFFGIANSTCGTILKNEKSKTEVSIDVGLVGDVAGDCLVFEFFGRLGGCRID